MPQNWPKYLGQGAKGVLVYVDQKPFALVQKRAALVQNRVALVQETLGRLFLQVAKTPFAPSPNHFGQLWDFGPLQQRLGVASLSTLSLQRTKKQPEVFLPEVFFCTPWGYELMDVRAFGSWTSAPNCLFVQGFRGLPEVFDPRRPNEGPRDLRRMSGPKTSLRETKPGGSRPRSFPLFSGKFLIVSWTLLGMVLAKVLLTGRERGKAQIKKSPKKYWEDPRKIRKVPKRTKKGKKGKKKENMSRQRTLAVEPPPRLAARKLSLWVVFSFLSLARCLPLAQAQLAVAELALPAIMAWQQQSRRGNNYFSGWRKRSVFWQTVVLPDWHPPLSSFSSVSGIWAPCFGFGSNVNRHFLKFLSKPPLFSRGQKHRFPKTLLHSPLEGPTRKPRHASVFGTHSDTQAVPALHCIRMFKGIFSAL